MSSPSDIKAKVNRGLAWIGLASSVVWVLDIVGMLIILTLWISPDEMGVAAVAISLFPVLDLVGELGLSAAIIQKDDHTEHRIQTVFWLNLGATSAVAATLALVVGPALAAVHGHSIVALLLTAYGGKLVWHNVYLVPQALMRRDLRFRELSIIRTLSNIAEFAAKVGVAAAGFGIWCFVIAPICRSVVAGIGIQMRNPWRPRLMFHLRETASWVTFGLKASGSQIIYHIYTNVDYQVVGYMFGSTATGLYWFAYELVLKPCFLIGQILQTIAFPAYSRLRHDHDRLIAQFISFTRLSLVVMCGFLAVVVLLAPDILWLVWGDAGTLAAPAARILCGVGLLRALSFVIPPLLDGLGRPGLSLTYNLIAATSLTSLFFASAYLLGPVVGYLSVAYAWIIGYPIAFLALLWITFKLLALRVLSYLRQTLVIPLCAGLAIGAGSVVRWSLESMLSLERFLLAMVVVLGVFVMLLGYLAGISPRSVLRSLRGSGSRSDSSP